MQDIKINCIFYVDILVFYFIIIFFHLLSFRKAPSFFFWKKSSWTDSLLMKLKY